MRLCSIDKIKKGRIHRPIGSKNPNASLDEQQVINIKRLLKQGKSTKEVSRLTGNSHGKIYKISINKTWKHVII